MNEVVSIDIASPLRRSPAQKVSERRRLKAMPRQPSRAPAYHATNDVQGLPRTRRNSLAGRQWAVTAAVSSNVTHSQNSIHELWKRARTGWVFKMSGWSLWIDLGDFAEALRIAEGCTPNRQAADDLSRQAGTHFHQELGSQRRSSRRPSRRSHRDMRRDPANLPPLFATYASRGYLGARGACEQALAAVPIVCGAIVLGLTGHPGG